MPFLLGSVNCPSCGTAVCWTVSVQANRIEESHMHPQCALHRDMLAELTRRGVQVDRMHIPEGDA